MVKFEPHITGLRAIAVLAVIVFHFDLFYLPGGFTGVDIFFVISGYLMAKIILKENSANNFSFINFYYRRLRRVFPVLAVVILFCILWAFFFLLPSDLVKFLKSAVHSLHFTSNMFFLKESGYFDTLNENKLLIHTWTLSLEAQFYLIFPVILLAILKAGRYWKSLLWLLALTSFAYCVLQTHSNQESAFFVLPTRLWEFLLGAIAAVSSATNSKLKTANIMALLGMGLIGLGFYIIDENSIFPGYLALLPVLGTFLLLKYSHSFIGKISNNKAVQYIGNISYSLYLWHWPLYVIALQQLNRQLVLEEALLLLLLTFIVSGLSYRFIEQPVRRNKDFWTNKKVIALFLAVLIIGFVLKTVAKNNNGFPDRFEDYISRAGEVEKYQSGRQKECFRDTDGNKDAKEDFCLMGGAEKTPNLILWGDSHADHLHLVIDEILSENDISGYVATFGACPATLGRSDESPYESSKLENKYQKCREFNKQVISLISDSENIDNIIIAAQWQRYKSEFMAKQLVGLSCSEGLKDKSFTIIGSVPNPGFVVPNKWANEQLSLGAAIDDMHVSYVSQKEAMQKFAAIEALVKQNSCARVSFVHPIDYFCKDEKCVVVENGKALFSDSSHLTIDGAKKIKTPISKTLQN